LGEGQTELEAKNIHQIEENKDLDKGFVFGV
jgi:hypothetical protein